MQKSGSKRSTKRIAILASGTGSNAKAILEYFKNNQEIKVELIISNNPEAKVLDLGKDFGVETMVINRKMFRDSTRLDEKFSSLNIDLIVLAGFLWLIPERLVKLFPSAIVNIHPALLPKYGGKGMYGMNVHHAVKESGDKESGITIHLIDESYDRGTTVQQEKVAIHDQDTAQDIASKVLKLEHYFFPRVIERLLIEGEL